MARSVLGLEYCYWCDSVVYHGIYIEGYVFCCDECYDEACKHHDGLDNV
jgi:hypothetical protein